MNPILKLPADIINLIITTFIEDKNKFLTVKLVCKNLYDTIMQYRLSNGLTRISNFNDVRLLKIATNIKIDYSKHKKIFSNYGYLKNIRKLYLTDLNINNKRNSVNLMSKWMKNLNITKLELLNFHVDNLIIPNSVKFLDIDYCSFDDLIINPAESQLQEIYFDDIIFKNSVLFKDVLPKLKSIKDIYMEDICVESNPSITLPEKLNRLVIDSCNFVINDVSSWNYKIKSFTSRINKDLFKNCSNYYFLKRTETLSFSYNGLDLKKNIKLDNVKYINLNTDIDMAVEPHIKLILPNLKSMSIKNNYQNLEVNPNLLKLTMDVNCVFDEIQGMINSFQKLESLTLHDSNKSDVYIEINYLCIKSPNLKHLHINSNNNALIDIKSKMLETIVAHNIKIGNFHKDNIIDMQLIRCDIDNLDCDNVQNLKLINNTIKNLKQSYKFKSLKSVNIYQLADDWGFMEFIVGNKLINQFIQGQGPKITVEKNE